MDNNNLKNDNTVKKETKEKEDVEVLKLWEPHADEITDAKDRHIKMSKQSSNKIVIALVAIGAFLIMWYATFAQPLAFNVRQVDDGAWNIGFTDMEIADVTGDAKEISGHDFTSTKAKFYVSLTGPGDSIVYDLTIKNSGSLNAEVDSIYVVPASQPGDQIVYSVGGINVGDKLDAGESTHMTMTVMYNNNATKSEESVRKDMSVIINYKQA